MPTFASDGTELPAPAAPAPAAPIDEPDTVVDVEPEVVASEPDSPPVVPEVDDTDIQDVEVVTDALPALAETWVHQSDWKYDWLDYKGDKLAIRVPHQNALTALVQAGQQCTPEFQADLTQKFVKRHISQESIERVLERMSDPDDAEYAAVEIGVWGDLLRIIAKIGGARALKDAEALAAVQNDKA